MGSLMPGCMLEKKNLQILDLQRLVSLLDISLANPSGMLFLIIFGEVMFEFIKINRKVLLRYVISLSLGSRHFSHICVFLSVYET